jgi:hypothetical protein
MLTLRVLLIASGCFFSACDANSEEYSSQKIADDNKCPTVYLLSPQGGIGSFNDPVWEVNISAIGSPKVTKGKLFRRDWGAFRSCEHQITINFRAISSALSMRGPRITEYKERYVLTLLGRSKVYFEMGRTWAEVPEKRGEETKLEIERQLGPPTVTGWDWEDRRKLYYAPICLERSELCP